MKMGKAFLFAVVLAVILVAAMSMEITERDLASEESLWDLYERWRSHHTVSRDLSEKRKRFNVFKANVHHIHKVNQKDKPYKLKLNSFADMTNHEFREFYSSKVKHYRMLHGSRANTGFMHGKTESLPASVDWRKQGAVTGVKNQGKCGSCWAFSTVVGVEGINKIKTGQLVSLSEQELVDCETDNEGCNGGLMENAYEFIKKSGGITTERLYPYKARDGSCDSSKMNAPAVTIDGHEMVPANDENALMKAVANQPVSVAIDASGSDMQFYSEGVYTGDSCGNELDHGVAVVGYGTALDGTKYWIVKNSWGTGWGEQGYIRMQRGVDAAEGGVCGIAMEASYPLKLSSHNPKPSPPKDDL
ncbi:unnamed protein product [Coffea canephora]|uniref:Uncharacterized protein n=2 Tax=Coffea TaxID=13442 RepID=A0A068UXY8_COFCA|nr:vignain-like [Coffea arabica]CDP13261.1 unnamed protein product [Coffea canephora]